MPDAIIDGTGNGYPLKVHSDGSITTRRDTFALRQDFDSGTFMIYLGEAEPGTLDSAGVESWRIRKFSYSGTQLTKVEWAYGYSYDTDLCLH